MLAHPDSNVIINTNKLSINISDKGTGFDTRQLKTPDIREYAKKSKQGGLGIYLMKTLMDKVEYDFNPGIKNQVQMIKFFNTQKSA